MNIKYLLCELNLNSIWQLLLFFIHRFIRIDLQELLFASGTSGQLLFELFELLLIALLLLQKANQIATRSLFLADVLVARGGRVPVTESACWSDDSPELALFVELAGRFELASVSLIMV